MQGVEAVAHILKIEGVEYLFSYPNNSLIDAAASIGIRPVIARSEKTLINMADGYARATNGTKPTVITLQAGPGIENAFGGLAQAYADGIPILTIPGGPDQHRIGEPPDFDPIPVYRHISKWAVRANFVERVPELMSRAFAQLRNGKLGPVMLELPRDIAAATLKDDDFHYTPRRGYKSAGNPADVAEAAKLLLNAKRPILHVGHGVLWAQASAELLELAELVQVPVMTTMAGKSAFPEDHPLALGAGGHTLTRTAAHFLVKADVVFGIGSSFAKGGFSTPIPAGKTIVQVVVDGKDIDKDYTVDHAIIGDAKLVLQQLLAEVKRQLGAKGRSGSEVAEEVKNAKNVYLDEWLPRLTSDESPINPYRVIWDLMHTVDRKNTMLTHDSGNPRDQTMSFYESVAPRGYIGWGKSTQLGTGYGIAMGAKLANPDKLVINVMGDLAFGTAGMEVETAVREKIAIMTVLLNNSCMGGYGHHMPNASQAFNSNKLSGDYAGVAKALGAYSEKVERPEDVVGAIKRGIQATQEGRPVLLEMITKEEPVYPAAVHVLKDAASGTLTPIGH